MSKPFDISNYKVCLIKKSKESSGCEYMDETILVRDKNSIPFFQKLAFPIFNKYVVKFFLLGLDLKMKDKFADLEFISNLHIFYRLRYSNLRNSQNEKFCK